MAQALRPLALVRLKAKWVGAVGSDLPLANDLPLVYLGEIANMPEHGVFAGHKSGRIYSGYHINQFEELPAEEV
jgi:hypothetical protein